jgi:hypothetical protein
MQTILWKPIDISVEVYYNGCNKIKRWVMKKILSTFLAAITLLVTITFSVGCEEIENRFVYKEVQKVTYALGGNWITRESKYFCEYEIEEVTEEEYLIVGNKYCDNYEYYTSGKIQRDRTVYEYNIGEKLTLEELEEYTKYAHYIKEIDGGELDENYNYIHTYSYKKITYTNVIISLINVKFIDENTFELKYYDEQVKEFVTQKINSDNYEISYFI